MALIIGEHLRGAETDLDLGLNLIKAVSVVVYRCHPDDGKSLINSLKAGTRLLRGVHERLCKAIGDDNDALNYEEANVECLRLETERLYEMAHEVEVSVKAAVLNSFLYDCREERQVAAVEQIRSAAMILKNLIFQIEKPRSE